MRSPVRPNRAGALVPPFDPFARGAGERYLPTGTRITLLISRQSYGSPRGSRVVVGSVRGYAPRSRTSVDLELDRISTWLQEDPADEVETLPAEFSALFRVSLVGSLRQSFGRLIDPGVDGRLGVSAVEIPRDRCDRPGCGARLPDFAVYCPKCGVRVSVGLPIPRFLNRPARPQAGACPGCWSEFPGGGAFCSRCGFDLVLARTVAEALVDQRVFLRLHEGPRRFGQLFATIRAARLERRFKESAPQIYARIGDCQPIELSNGLTLPSDFSTIVVLSGYEDTRRLLSAIAAQHPIRASEPLRRCGACGGRSRSTRPYVRGRYCTGCGQRMRIMPHRTERERLHADPPLRVVKHECGGLFLEGAHDYCGSCGDSLERFQPGGGRLALIS